MILGAIAVQIVAMLVFASAGSLDELFAGRILQGIATGAALGAIGAAMIETHPRHGAAANSAAPAAGTGIGALLSGLLVRYLPAPTHTVYLVLAGGLAAQLVAATAIILAPEVERRARGVPDAAAGSAGGDPTGRGRRRSRAVCRLGPRRFLRCALPGAARRLVGKFVGCARGFRSLPAGERGLPDHLALRDAEPSTVLAHRSGRAVGSGVAGVLLAISVRSIGGLLLATAIAGMGFGSGFQGALRTVLGQTPAADRAAVLSTLYLVCYLGMGDSGGDCGLAGRARSRPHKRRSVVRSAAPGPDGRHGAVPPQTTRVSSLKIDWFVHREVARCLVARRPPSSRPAAKSPAARSSARQRILDVANDLFYREGVHTVGIDRIIEEAGVAKASLYNSFRGKDDLVRTYLEGRRHRVTSRILAAIDGQSDPRDRLLAVFDAQAAHDRLNPDSTAAHFRALPPKRIRLRSTRRRLHTAVVPEAVPQAGRSRRGERPARNWPDSCNCSLTAPASRRAWTATDTRQRTLGPQPPNCSKPAQPRRITLIPAGGPVRVSIGSLVSLVACGCLPGQPQALRLWTAGVDLSR